MNRTGVVSIIKRMYVIPRYPYVGSTLAGIKWFIVLMTPISSITQELMTDYIFTLLYDVEFPLRKGTEGLNARQRRQAPASHVAGTSQITKWPFKYYVMFFMEIINPHPPCNIA